MKKTLSLLLCVILCFSCLTLTVCAADELTIAVANDLHYSLQYANKDYPTRNDNTEGYSHAAATGQLYTESAAIIDAFFQRIIENKDSFDFVLLPGDLVDKGTVEENQIFAAILKEYEDALGLPVYVVPGNHDLYYTSAEEFASIYAEFGYNEAIARDTNSVSYVVDLNDDYRLLAVDSTEPGEGRNGITAERVAWLKAQAEKAQEDGKKVIAMMHHNLLTHFIFSEIVHNGAAVEMSKGLADAFAETGVKYTFTGHSHEHDIASYTNDDGVTIYDVLSSTINAYPCPYRVVKFTDDEVDIKTNFIDSIDTTNLPTNLEADVLELRNTNFHEYAKNCSYIGLCTMIDSYITSERITSMLGITKEDNEDVYNIVSNVCERLKEALILPLYIEDETNGKTSLERITIQNGGLSYPESDYNNLTELAITIYQAHVFGDENYPIYSNEMCIASKAIASLLYYTLSDVSSEDYALILNFLAEKLDIPLPVDFTSYISTEIKKYEGAEILVSAAIMPLLTEISTDFGPEDNNVTLPGYSHLIEEEQELTFWEKIIEFFQKIRDFFRSLFAR